MEGLKKEILKRLLQPQEMNVTVPQLLLSKRTC